MSRRQASRDRSKNLRAGAAPAEPSVPIGPRPFGPRQTLTLLAILFATALAFAPAIRAPFDFDDIASIPKNPTIERLSANVLHPPPGIAVSGRPVVNVSLAIDYAINELLGVDQRADPDGPRKTIAYHVVNVLLHLLSGLLLFGCVRRTIGAMSGDASPDDWRHRANGLALAVAGLWLLHPIQTEAVDYVIQRTELLVSACYLATVYASIRAWDAGAKRRRVAWYTAAVAACALGMGSKEVMISAPLAVLLYDRTFRVTTWRALMSPATGRPWFYLVLAATALWLVALVAGGGRLDTVGFNLGVTWYQYAYSQAWAIAHYIRLMLWPDQLTYDYGQQPIHGLRGIPGLVLLTALGIVTVVAWTRDRWRWLGFLGAWFFLLLAPSSSVIPIRTEIAAERRIYLASASVVVVVVLGVDWLLRRGAAMATTHGRAGLVSVCRAGGRWLFAGVAALLLVATYRRSALYATPEALWRDATQKQPANARAYDNLAAVIIRASPGRSDEAEQLLRHAVVVDSTYVTAFTNLADIELQRGRTQEARTLLERAVAINPRAVDAVARLGGVLLKLGEPERAIPLLERVTAQFPTDESLATLAAAYNATGRRDDAIAASRRAFSLNPARTDAAEFAGSQLLADGHADEALPYLEAAVRPGTASAMTSALLALSYAQLGRADDASRAANAAALRAGNDVQVFIVIGRAMLLAQRGPDATRFFGEAVRLAPTDPEALTRFGIANAAAGNDSAAGRLFRRALSIQPGYPPAVQALRQLDASPRR